MGSVPGHRVDLACELLVNHESRVKCSSYEVAHWTLTGLDAILLGAVLVLFRSHVSRQGRTSNPGRGKRHVMMCQWLRREATRCREEGNDDGAKLTGAILGERAIGADVGFRGGRGESEVTMTVGICLCAGRSGDVGAGGSSCDVGVEGSEDGLVGDGGSGRLEAWSSRAAEFGMVVTR